MDPAEKKRKTIIGAALLATLVAVMLVEDEDETVIETVGPAASTQSAKPARPSSARGSVPQARRSDDLDVDQLGQRKFEPLAGELFASTSWAPKPPPITPQQQAAMLQQQRAKVKAPPPAPTPPPLQFKYIGKAIEGNRTWVFLTQADENYIAKIGEKIDDRYRLDTISDESVTLTYLPLNAKQILPIHDNKQAGNFR
ncbi:MAG: hypothetical protein KF908_07750 [Nitrosomonas sp.]|nr:hypothetical protein [Nitrosomonas sp.]MCW5607174.1 hypothetical protein [Nitrosomonas sp.]